MVFTELDNGVNQLCNGRTFEVGERESNSQDTIVVSRS
jgi:hypothetical protein